MVAEGGTSRRIYRLRKQPMARNLPTAATENAREAEREAVRRETGCLTSQAPFTVGFGQALAVSR
jgi:hypothetical protein